jgi:CHAT domain-containing protein
MKKYLILMLICCSSLLPRTARGQTVQEMAAEAVKLHQNKQYDAAIRLLHRMTGPISARSGQTSNAYAEVLLTIGLNYNDAGQPDSARRYYELGVDLQKKVLGAGHKEVIANQRILADLYYGIKNYRGIRDIYTGMIAASGESADKDRQEDYIQDLNDLAIVYGFLNDRKNAWSRWQQVLAVCAARLPRTDYLYVRVIQNFGDYCRHKGLYKDAEQVLNRIVTDAVQTGQPENLVVSAAKGSLARIYIDWDRSDEARKAITVTERLQKNFQMDDLITFEGIATRAELYSQQNDSLAKAVRYFRITLDYLNKHDGGDNYKYADLLTSLSNVYITSGNYDLAYDSLKRAEAILRANHEEHSHEYARVMLAYGNLMPVIGRGTLAEQYLEIGLTEERQANGEENLTFVQLINALAMQYVARNNFKDALLLYDHARNTALRLFGERGPLFETILINIGSANFKLGRRKEAEFYLLGALVYGLNYHTADDLDLAILNADLMAVHLENKEMEKARASFSDALRYFNKLDNIDNERLGGLYNNLGYGYMAFHDNVKAAVYYRKALQNIKAYHGIDNQGYIMALGNNAAMDRSLGRMADAEKEMIDCDSLSIAYLKQNFLALGMEDKSQLLLSYDAIFDASSSLVQALGSNCSLTFLQKACNMQLMYKAIILSDQQQTLQNLRKGTRPEMPDWLARLQAAKEKFAALNTSPGMQRKDEIDQLEQTILHQQKQIDFFGGSLDAPTLFDFRTIQRALGPTDAAVEFLRFHEFNPAFTPVVRYAAYVIRPGSSAPHFVPLCDEAALAKLLETKADNMSEAYIKELYGGAVGDPANKYSKSNAIYQLVFASLEKELGSATHLILSPVGLLYQISFHALPTGNDRYLIDRYDIREFNTLRDFADEGNRPFRVSGATAKLFTNIDYGAPQRKFLNFADEHAGDLQKVLRKKGLSCQVISGQAATEDELKALGGQSPAILQITTHGFSLKPWAEPGKKNLSLANQFERAEDPMFRNGITLAGANRTWSGAMSQTGRQDGILTAYELGNIDLSHTDLIVLSACRGALGDLQESEGVFGLQRAIKLSGAKKMILGLWDLGLDATNDLLGAFYQDLNNSKPLYESYLTAMRNLRKTGSPYDWAGLKLIE